VPRNRIFTINSNGEVLLDLLSLNKLKLSYVNMTEVVDHYFPPVSTLVKGGGEEYTDFRYWRDTPLELDEFSASDSDEQDEPQGDDHESQYAEDEDEEAGEGMADSYMSRESIDDDGEGEDSVMSGSVMAEDHMMSSMMEGDDEDADDEKDEDDDDADGEAEDNKTHTLHVEPDTKPKPHASPRIAVEDINAEVISGIMNLTMEKEVKQ
jgi:phosphatidate phosphatase LPIN